MTSESSISTAPSKGFAENLGGTDTRTDAFTTLNWPSVLELFDFFSLPSFFAFLFSGSFELPAEPPCFRFFDEEASEDIRGGGYKNWHAQDVVAEAYATGRALPRRADPPLPSTFCLAHHSTSSDSSLYMVSKIIAEPQGDLTHVFSHFRRP